MARQKGIDKNLDDIKIDKCFIDYSPLFKLLNKYNVTQEYFKVYAANIPESTMQRFRSNKNVQMNTILKIINGLNKINPNKKHNINDILKMIYK